MSAGRPPNDDEAYLAAVTIRLHPSEKEKLKDDARMAGLSMSELIRRQYFNRPIIAHADRRSIDEMRRLGGLMKKIHNDSGGAYSEQTARILSDIQTIIKRLNNDHFQET